MFSVSDFYNYADFNRENGNVEFLRDILVINGYNVILTYPVDIANRAGFPTVTRINQLRQNIIDLFTGFYYPPDAPEVTVNPARKQIFNYVEANKLEVSLQLIYDLVHKMLAEFKYCGAYTCGEEGGLY
jgi:hypothetical protein